MSNFNRSKQSGMFPVLFAHDLLGRLDCALRHKYPDLYTGLRRGELLSLRKDELDFNFNVIQLRRTKSRRGHVIVGRTIPMESIVKDVLWSQCQKHEGEYLFINPKTDKPYTDIKKGFAKACQKAKLEDFTFHDLRHHADSPIMPTPHLELAVGGARAAL